MSHSLATEHRNRQRYRTLLSGKIVFNSGFSTADCVVKNLSDSGACVELPSVAGIPSAFDLIVGSDGSRMRCKVAWMRGRRIGVAFEPNVP